MHESRDLHMRVPRAGRYGPSSPACFFVGYVYIHDSSQSQVSMLTCPMNCTVPTTVACSYTSYRSFSHA